MEVQQESQDPNPEEYKNEEVLMQEKYSIKNKSYEEKQKMMEQYFPS